MIFCPPPSPDSPPPCAFFCIEGACCADWNQDGEVNPDDLAEYVTDWASGSACADINLSGEVDADDLASYVAAYFGA